MKLQWWVDWRDVVLLGLLGLTSLGLFIASLIFLRQANDKEQRAMRVIVQADSLMKDWVKRGCAPRTVPVP